MADWRNYLDPDCSDYWEAFFHGDPPQIRIAKYQFLAKIGVDQHSQEQHRMKEDAYIIEAQSRKEIMNGMTRRSFVSTAATGAAALAAMGTVKSAEGQLVYTKSDWKVSEFNQLAKNPARVKQLCDITAIADGRFLNNIKNSLNGLHYGFGIPEEQIKIVAALHGSANMLNYDDFIWNKYQIGAWLKVNDPSAGHPAVKNLFYPSKAGTQLHYSSENPDSPESLYQDTSIQALQHRGVKLLACHTATEEQARALIAHNRLTQQPEEIVKEMLAHTLPEVLVVASMVAAIALLQTERQYSYITA